jgi:hypothetical protein
MRQLCGLVRTGLVITLLAIGVQAQTPAAQTSPPTSRIRDRGGCRPRHIVRFKERSA